MTGDGFEWINIYSKGATELGRALSNFSSHKVITIDGTFASIEGYWYWLAVSPDEPRRGELKEAVGWQAKALGRELRGVDWVKGGDTAADFRLRIAVAMTTKLILHPSIRYRLAESVLPFRHYYVYGGKVVEPKEGHWIVALWEHLRQLVKS